MRIDTVEELTEAIAREVTRRGPHPFGVHVTAALGPRRDKLIVRHAHMRDRTFTYPLIPDGPGRGLHELEYNAELSASGILGLDPGYDHTAAGVAMMVDVLLAEIEDDLDRRMQARVDDARRAEDERHAALDLIGVAEAARIAGVSEDAMRKHLRRGTCPRPVPVAGSDAVVWQRWTIEDWALTRPRRGRPAGNH